MALGSLDRAHRPSPRDARPDSAFDSGTRLSRRRVLRFAVVFLGFLSLWVTSMSQAAPSVQPITKQKALEIAKKAVAKFKPGTEFVIHEDRTLEREFGWVFFYSPKAYLQTRNPRNLVPGAGPLVVERLGGGTQYLSTSVPPEQAVTEFERRWRGGQPR